MGLTHCYKTTVFLHLFIIIMSILDQSMHENQIFDPSVRVVKKAVGVGRFNAKDSQPSPHQLGYLGERYKLPSWQTCHKYTVCKYKYKYSETLQVQVQVQILAKFTSTNTSTSTEFQVQVLSSKYKYEYKYLYSQVR